MTPLSPVKMTRFNSSMRPKLTPKIRVRKLARVKSNFNYHMYMKLRKFLSGATSRDDMRLTRTGQWLSKFLNHSLIVDLGRHAKVLYGEAKVASMGMDQAKARLISRLAMLEKSSLKEAHRNVDDELRERLVAELSTSNMKDITAQIAVGGTLYTKALYGGGYESDMQVSVMNN